MSSLAPEPNNKLRLGIYLAALAAIFAAYGVLIFNVTGPVQDGAAMVKQMAVLFLIFLFPGTFSLVVAVAFGVLRRMPSLIIVGMTILAAIYTIVMVGANLQ